jgi:hypothetical protein
MCYILLATMVAKAREMPSRMLFTPQEREKLGVLVNNIAIFAAQMVNHRGSAFTAQALMNLAKLTREDEDFLKRLDQLAREQQDESPLRLIEDLAQVPSGVLEKLTVVRRCLLASAFLGHCMAQPAFPDLAAVPISQEKQQLH